MATEAINNALAELVRWMHAQGWSPATSTNYSYLDDDGIVHVSRSGIDKSLFADDDFLPMQADGTLLPAYKHMRPSAETGIHLMLYQQTDSRVVLHTHSRADTLLSRRYHAQGAVRLSGYELLKGLRNIDTHDSETVVPIFANDQHIDRLSLRMQDWLQSNNDCQGLLIERHGFYCWGRSLAEAKRHIEVFQFLFDQELQWLLLNS